jgi:chromosome segregation ATPase
MADQSVTTSIDTLVSYINEKGETDSFTIAHKLGVSEETIRAWVDILEKAGMIKISYKVGKMYLSPVKVDENAANAPILKMTKSVEEMRKSDIVAEVNMQDQMVTNIYKKIDSFSKTADEAEKAFRDKRKDTKEALDRIVKLEQEINNSYAAINTKKESVNTFAEDLKKQLDGLKTSSTDIAAFSLDSSGAKALLDDLKKKVQSYGTDISELKKEFNTAVEEYRKIIANIEANSKKEIDALKQISAKEQEEIRKYEKAIEIYKRREGEIRRRSERMSKSILDDAIQAKSEVDRLYEVAEKEIKNANVEITNLKAKWGGLAEFNDKLIEIKKNIAILSKDNEAVRNELDAIRTEMRKLEMNKSLKASEKNAKIEALANRSKATFEKIAESERKKDQLDKDTTDITS